MTALSASQILLVEDDEAARISLSHVLGRTGYAVRAVPDGEEAVAILDSPITRDQFDVILTDLLLPEVDGIQVLKKARELPDPPEVILLTGYGTLQTAIESLRSGAFDYLLKPCKPEDLLRCVEKATQRRNERRAQSAAVRIIAQGLAHLQGETANARASGEAHPARPVDPEQPQLEQTRIGELVINHREYAATFAGRPLSLTPTEYTLLCCLAGTPGQMVTYSAIARYVYHQDLDDIAAHQLLKTHIHNLRHKIDPAYIVNVRSTGYRLIAPLA